MMEIPYYQLKQWEWAIRDMTKRKKWVLMATMYGYMFRQNIWWRRKMPCNLSGFHAQLCALWNYADWVDGLGSKCEIDDLYYICIAYVQAIGLPLSQVDILENSGNLVLKYSPDWEHLEGEGDPWLIETFSRLQCSWKFRRINAVEWWKPRHFSDSFQITVIQRTSLCLICLFLYASEDLLSSILYVFHCCLLVIVIIFF